MPNGVIICERELSGSPEWAHLIPLGQLKTRDGRKFALNDAEGVIAQFKARGQDLPVDYEHQSERESARLAGPVRAAGWITDLETRESGIWGRVEWTNNARAMIHAREYRYLSPVLFTGEDGEVLALKGAGLVHAPNLHLTALNNEDNMPEPQDVYPDIAKLLGLPGDSDPLTIFTALKKLPGEQAKPDPRKYVPVEALQEAMANNVGVSTQVRQERAERKVEDAFSQGYLTGAGKAWALELCLADEAAFDRFIDVTVPRFAGLTTPLKKPQHLVNEDAAHPSSETAMLSEQLGLDPSRFNRD